MVKICFALTNRTNYSKIRPILFEIQKLKKYKPYIVLSSSILLDRYGNSYQDILNDGFDINMKIDCVMMNDSHEAMAKTVGLSIIEHSTYFKSLKPELLVVVGDRFDMLAPVVAASMMNIKIAHIQGGEESGTIDNVIRDVITRFSHKHFVSTNKSAKNLENYGVSRNSIHNFGCPAVEYISSFETGKYFDVNKLGKKYKRDIKIAPKEKFLLLMIHPDTTNKDDVDMNIILNEVVNLEMKSFIFYPNIDANNSSISEAMATFKNHNNLYFIRHMPLEGFIHTMAHSSCFITNSSSGIREAASFGTPVINLGFRQIGRERNSNVFDIENKYHLLSNRILELINQRFEKKNIYFKPNCAKMITSELVKVLN